jgi:hypothetical protein
MGIDCYCCVSGGRGVQGRRVHGLVERGADGGIVRRLTGRKVAFGLSVIKSGGIADEAGIVGR